MSAVRVLVLTTEIGCEWSEVVASRAQVLVLDLGKSVQRRVRVYIE